MSKLDTIMFFCLFLSLFIVLAASHVEYKNKGKSIGLLPNFVIILDGFILIFLLYLLFQ